MDLGYNFQVRQIRLSRIFKWHEPLETYRIEANTHTYTSGVAKWIFSELKPERQSVKYTTP